MVTRFVVNYYILPIDANASARQNVVITTFCNVTTFWVATKLLLEYKTNHPIAIDNRIIRTFKITNIHWKD